MSAAWVGVILAGLAAGVLLFLLLRRTRGSQVAEIAELGGRLKQMAESQTLAQTQLGERLQAQERALSRTLEERLTEVSRRLTEGLEKSTNQTQTSMTALKERLVVIDVAQKNITELSTQVVGLQDILANKQARGAFGEIQLKDLVENVLPPSAYRFQATLSNGKVADCLIDLPNPPGPIAIDAKFPLEAYHALREAKDDIGRKQAERAFRTDVMAHVQSIMERYIVPGDTGEAALMFLPSEAVYAELHASFQDIVQKSYEARVFIVSPTTLWATLNTVRAVFKDVRMREQAEVIQEELRRIMVDIGRLDKRVGNLQRHFDQAAEDVREIRISTEKITGRADRIDSLQFEEPTETTAPLDSPPPVKLVSD